MLEVGQSWGFLRRTDMFQIRTNSICREDVSEEGKLSLLEQALAKLEPNVLGM